MLGRVGGRIERLTRPRGELLPPLHLRWRYYGTTRPSVFPQLAAAAAAELLTRGLKPDDRVLDVGCGVGPLAVGLIPHLTGGSYDGFDVHAEAVEWCDRAITSRHPRFRFRHADLANGLYNPGGTFQAAEYRFPYPDGTFDFAFLGSICTHLPPGEVAHYLGETARVLRPGGKAVVSFYLLDPESLQGIAAGTSAVPFTVPWGDGGSRVADLRNPERAVAHPADVVHSLYAASGLSVVGPVRRGGWWAGAAHRQDVVEAAKPEMDRKTCSAA
jgi:SAM-dependent methyltransferase